MKNAERLFKILLSPVISEKATVLGSEAKQLCFRVTSCATKEEIKQAIELVFEAKVASVRVLNQAGAQRRFGKIIGRRSSVRKAYISLQPGQELDFSKISSLSEVA